MSGSNPTTTTPGRWWMNGHLVNMSTDSRTGTGPRTTDEVDVWFYTRGWWSWAGEELGKNIDREQQLFNRISIASNPEVKNETQRTVQFNLIYSFIIDVRNYRVRVQTERPHRSTQNSSTAINSTPVTRIIAAWPNRLLKFVIQVGFCIDLPVGLFSHQNSTGHFDKSPRQTFEFITIFHKPTNGLIIG